MFLNVALTTVDFHSNEVGSPVTILITVGVIFLIGIIFACVFKQTIIVVFSFCMAMMVAVFMMIAFTLVGASNSSEKVVEFQVWAEDEYMLTINDDDAAEILRYQLSEKEYEKMMSEGKTVKRIPVTDVYGTPIEVKLIEDNNEWYFVVTETKVLTSTREPATINQTIVIYLRSEKTL